MEPRNTTLRLVVGAASAILAVTVCAAVHANARAAGPALARWTDTPRLPAIVEYRYELTARVRPIPIPGCWFTRPNVGGARVAVGRDGRDGRSYELLIGSDPARAPMRLNRWGYIAETSGDGTARVVGVMTESGEQSVDQAKAALDGQPRRQHAFKAIRASIADRSSSAQVVRVAFDQDFTFYDVDALLGRLPEGGDPTARLQIANGTSPGLLTALADLMRHTVDVWASTNGTAGRERRTFVWDRGLYDLTLARSQTVETVRAAGRAYQKCLRSVFEVRGPGKNDGAEFEVTYGTADPTAGIPVLVKYRPRWWFEIELVLANSAGDGR